VHPSLDASPRGGEPGFVKVLDAQTLLIPDAPGNNRLDTLENIVATGQLGLLFMVPGLDEMLRDQIQAFRGETIEVEPQAAMLERYKESL
jgi:predicted pyridoxine 5'-phosphate oxidase superfamily flavin-nucleotide-binding protein